MKEKVKELIAIDFKKRKVKKVDCHIHSQFSDGLNSIEEIINVSIAKKLDVIAITDHVWRSSDWIERYSNEINRLNHKYKSIKILKGAEAKILDDIGNIDITEQQANKLDFVMGVVHKMAPNSKHVKDITTVGIEEALLLEKQRILALIQNPFVDVIGHPLRTFQKFFYSKNNQTPSSLYKYIEEIALAAKKAGKLIELNKKLFFKNKLFDFLLKKEAFFSFGSDAHDINDVGNINYHYYQQFISKGNTY